MVDANRDPVRVGIVGLGVIAQIAHLPVLRRLTSQFQVTAVCDLSQALSRQIAGSIGRDVHATTDAAEIIDNPDVDAILVLTSGRHAPLVVSALDAGKHVFVEKPLAFSLEEIDVVQQAVSRSNRNVTVGYMKTHETALRSALEMKPEIGELRMVRTTVLHPTESSQLRDHQTVPGDDVSADLLSEMGQTQAQAVTRAIGEVGPGLSWVYRKLALGSLVHQLSVLRSLLGSELNVQRVRMSPRISVESEPLEPPSLQVEIAGPNEIPVRIDWLWLPDHPSYEESTSLFATRGSLTLRFPPPFDTAATADLQATMTSTARRTVEEPGAMNAFAAQLAVFHRRVLEGATTDLAGVRSELVLLQDLVGLLADALGIEPGGELGIRRREARFVHV